ncbi:MAG TPA: hypothetical protein VFQ65_13935, partial [Kofleriaceae bacterium]|nr:hypothetical protein [Kofleriaceae bacterium]
MRGWCAIGLAIVGCHGGAQPAPVIAPPRVVAPAVAPATPATCAGDVPSAACTAYLATATTGALTRCDAASAGRWRYAVVAPLYSPTDDITAATLARMWRGTGHVAIAASAETVAALTPVLGTPHVEAITARP